MVRFHSFVCLSKDPIFLQCLSTSEQGVLVVFSSTLDWMATTSKGILPSLKVFPIPKDHSQAAQRQPLAPVGKQRAAHITLRIAHYFGSWWFNVCPQPKMRTTWEIAIHVFSIKDWREDKGWAGKLDRRPVRIWRPIEVWRKNKNWDLRRKIQKQNLS